MTAMDVMNGIPHLLWTTSWQAGVMAGAIWLACRQWPRMPANLRVMLWWLVSLKFAIGLAWTQPIGLPILPADATSENAVTIVTSVRGAEGADSPLPQRAKPLSLGEGFGEWVVSIWLLGVIVQCVLLLRQLLRTRHLIARSLPIEGDAAELFDDLITRLELDVRPGRRPELRVSTAIETPQVTGLTRPVVLLPVGALESFSTPELSLTLCHELMHVKRFDLWHGWIPSVAARLFFFHPLARLAAREYVIAREAACDARVLAIMDAPAHDYGRLLMRLGITARQAAPAAAGASPTLRTLKRRLLMLHDAASDARRLSPRWWALAAIAAVLVIPMRPVAQASPQDQRNDQNQQIQQNQQNPSTDSRNDDDAEPWVFVMDDDNTAAHGNALHVTYAKSLRMNASEPLIWFKRDGRGYVIRDRGTIDKARALFIQQESQDKAMRELEERQTILRAQQSDLAQIQDGLRDQVRDLDRKVVEAAAATQKTIAPPARPSDDDRRRVEEELQLREIRLRAAEASRLEVSVHQEATHAQQRAISEQQEALGEEQAALRRHLEERHRDWEQQLRMVMDRALAEGIATPVK